MSVQRLKRKLESIDGQGYKAYRELKGVYQFEGFQLRVDHVQGDPFASPSRIRVTVPQKMAGFGEGFFIDEARTLALESFLRREVDSSIAKHCGGVRGSGNSGTLRIHPSGQEMIVSSAIVARPAFVEARLFAGLPAHGRRAVCRVACEMFFDELPKIVQSAMIYRSLDSRLLDEWIQTAEDVKFIRGGLAERGLVAFVGDGSVLPRRTGVDERPMEGAVSFESDPELRVTFDTPNHGPLSGLAIPQGVTLIVGGGYHGKSTLLRALQRGVYGHIPGDGREWVVTEPTAVKIRAEDGRRVEKVDISPFISRLPMGRPTATFSTDDASGSTSQAANIVEALELGTRLLLIDEDTSATNFMIRDRRMQELVVKEKEPITPFIDQVRSLAEQHGVSTILVMGGAGDYLDVADLVIMMDNYLPRDVTSEARRVVQRHPTGRLSEAPGPLPKMKERRPLPASLDSRRGKREKKIDAKGRHAILFGRTLIDLSALEQLVDVGQTRAIGDGIYRLRERYLDGKRSLREAIDLVTATLQEEGLDVLSLTPRGDYVMPRALEIGFAVNRLRTLKVK